MAYIPITGEQVDALVKALVDAYPLPDDMARMLRARLDKHLYALVGAGSLNTMYFELIDYNARPQGWLDQLIVAALDSRQTHPGLLKVAQQLGLTAVAQDADEEPDDVLQRIIDQSHSLLDTSPWLEKMGRIERQICRVEVPKNNGATTYGTGFLLGPDVLITNYHVMQPVYDGKAAPEQVRLRFDYKVLSADNNQTVINDGTVFKLADNWDLDKSPYSAIDEKRDPKPHPPATDELDYALVRVKGKPGEKPFGVGTPEPGAPARGWISLPDPPVPLADKATVMIMQHPDKQPIKIAVPPGHLLQVNDNQTRIRYTTLTLGGSSGSPCFDANWQLMALHHAGDPNFDKFHNPTYNQGIPFGAILNLLEQRNKRDLLPA